MKKKVANHKRSPVMPKMQSMHTNTTPHPTPLTVAALIAVVTVSFLTGCEKRTVESTSEPATFPDKPSIDTPPAPEPVTAPDKPSNDAPPAPEPETAPNEPSIDTPPALEPETVPNEPSNDAPPAPKAVVSKFEGYEKIVKQTHQASLAARESALNKVVAEGKSWIDGAWGETLWCLAALYQNQHLEQANQQLLARAQAYNEAHIDKADFRPETIQKLSPWAYFALTDYVRILSLFHANSPHYPGRLQPETEMAMKEALWNLVKVSSKVKDADLKNLLVLHGTENHDLTLRPNYYLVAALLKDDPAFKDRKYKDRRTAAQHYVAYNRFFQEWPRQRIKSGLWIEIGSDTYQKYSWPALFNLHELSPDPLVRQRFGMLLDVAFIEEAQISINGRRGGGRSRAGYGKNNFEDYKNLLYAPEETLTDSKGASHSKVIETSRYQLPPAAILLRKRAFPAEEAFLIRNRVLGEHAEAPENDKEHFDADSALLNYAYRSPHYLLGSTWQNPALHHKAADRSGDILKYGGISRQNRWCGILFDHPIARQTKIPASNHRAYDELCAIFPEIKKTRGGRPQHPQWSFQHQEVLLIQRIDEHKTMGSYSTGQMSIRFHGFRLEKVERDGWIFASNELAYAAVKFLDSGYQWDSSGELASPKEGNGTPSSTRVILHAGDCDQYPSFAAFQESILENQLEIKTNKITYQYGKDRTQIEWWRYDPHKYKRFKLPKVNRQQIDLRPDWTFDSPYMKCRYQHDKVYVRVGPIKKVYDFSAGL